jgi:hypothetical protein
MNIRGTAVTTELLFNNRILTGLTTLPDEYYWSCSHIFECDPSELNYNDIKEASASDIPEGTFIHFPCKLSNYKYCNTISIGRTEDKLHFRLSVSFNLSKWDENLNLRGFFELLHDDIQQSRNLKVSDCYHDCHDYLLEVEFTGDLTEKFDTQLQRALIQIRQFHDYDSKHII